MSKLAIERKIENFSERKFLGKLAQLIQAPIKISTIAWAERYRVLTKEESFISGKFDCNRVPALEYIYDCLDNRFIYIVACMKASQVGWSELTNNFIGKTIHTNPCKMQWAFPGRELAKNYSREKLKPFFDSGTRVLPKLIDIDVPKKSFNFFKFPGGFLKLTTTGSIGSAKTSSIPLIGVEEPDDVKDDVAGQGDTLENLKGRQKSFPIGHKKLIFGGTPTFKDFSKVETAFKESNQLVFKPQCHHCLSLVELSFDFLRYDEYQDRFIHEVYGRYNPETAYYLCPACEQPWTWEEKNKNIEKGKEFGFYDKWGNFSKGWHAKRPEVEETFGFHIPELLSSFSESDYIKLAEKRIKAELALGKGDEGLMKSFVNNSMGLPYASGISSIEPEELRLLRSNYQEHIVPYEGLELTCGIDVQENRFAIIIRAWGRNNNSWLVTWKEIFGDTKNPDSPIWQQLAEETVLKEIPHVGGHKMRIKGVSIDSGHLTTLVYKWVNEMQEHNNCVFATKGVKDMDNRHREIYTEPALLDVHTEQNVRKTLAERMGITLFHIGAHQAQKEILSRINLNKVSDAKSYIYYFNEQTYGQYEEQMTSCRKLVDMKSGYNMEVFKLVPGKQKEAMDGEKNALHAAYAVGIPQYTNEHWFEIEQWLYTPPTGV